MKVVNLQQGTKEWHEFRANHFGASEAPAMMGESKYQSRDDLLQAKKFGAEDPDAATQALFDKGHETEEKARAIAEEIIGEELYPVTGHSEFSKLSASFDGVTLGS